MAMDEFGFLKRAIRDGVRGIEKEKKRVAAEEVRRRQFDQEMAVRNQWAEAFRRARVEDEKRRVQLIAVQWRAKEEEMRREAQEAEAAAQTAFRGFFFERAKLLPQLESLRSQAFTCALSSPKQRALGLALCKNRGYDVSTVSDSLAALEAMALEKLRLNHGFVLDGIAKARYNALTTPFVQPRATSKAKYLIEAATSFTS